MAAKASDKEIKMEYTRLGKSGLNISKLILGGMSYGSSDWWEWVLNEEAALPLLKHAYDAGITTWDTADMYSNGVSEKIIGNALKKYNIPRNRVVILTKCYFGVTDPEEGQQRVYATPGGDIDPKWVNRIGLSRKHIFDAVDASVERLGTYIDVLQIHRLDHETPREEIMKALNDVVESGKVRYIGASSMAAWEFQTLQNIAEKNGWHKFISMQNYYNLLYREEEREMIPYCKDTGVGLIPWSPMARGALARPYDSRSTVREGSDKILSGIVRKESEIDKTVVGRVQEVADKLGVSMARVAIAWALQKGTNPIVGLSSKERIDEAVEAVKWQTGGGLTEEDCKYLEDGTRRRKCTSGRGSTTCLYCTERGITCIRNSGAPSPSPQGYSAPSSPPVVRQPAAAGLPLPPPVICLELVELYFDFIHDKFHSIFHRPSLTEDVRQGVVPPVILFAIFALSARFSENEAFSGIPPRERSKPYYDESARLVDIRDTSIATIQACILLGGIGSCEALAFNESVYYTVACRMANLLGLSKRTGATPLEQELNIRSESSFLVIFKLLIELVWWTLCMVDVWSSKSVGLPRQMSHFSDLPLPIDEYTFLQWRRGAQDNTEVSSDRSSSLIAQMILLNRILMEINDTITETVTAGTVTLVLDKTVQDLSQKLDNWYYALPEYMHDTPQNLERYASQGLGRIFVAVYLGYYHYGQLLFYQFLHDDQHSTGGNRYANKCKAHAAGLCLLVYAAQETPGCEVRYNMIGHILVIASTVQIHTLLFGTDEAEIAVARSRVVRNFQILTDMQRWWAWLDMCFVRLHTFHDMCRRSMATSFRMDEWMMKFLSEFSKPIEEKTEDSTQAALDWARNIEAYPQGHVEEQIVGVYPSLSSRYNVSPP
ncbi:hypothetical protein V500_01667 [Pseudogymnoascus sp. VKM F-4518 (FW-2643)]|nr:hypothetical protein V500_01667 [Pseudogymnoascus sp. VKM F-4518 (FW-2643)]